MTSRTPALIVTQAPVDPAGIVLVLHGGQEDSRRRARRTQLAVLRMVPLARTIAARSDRLVVLRLLYLVRGWNGSSASPVADAEWALARAGQQYGADLPVALVGHSMGGRTALRVAGTPAVRSVVGLAPWLPVGEPTAQLAGRRVLIVHGLADHTTEPRLSATFAESLAGLAAQVSYVRVPGAKHSMLRRRATVDGLAAGYVSATLLGADDCDRPNAGGPWQSETSSSANLLRRVLVGEPWLVA